MNVVKRVVRSLLLVIFLFRASYARLQFLRKQSDTATTVVSAHRVWFEKTMTVSQPSCCISLLAWYRCSCNITEYTESEETDAPMVDDLSLAVDDFVFSETDDTLTTHHPHTENQTLLDPDEPNSLMLSSSNESLSPLSELALMNSFGPPPPRDSGNAANILDGRDAKPMDAPFFVMLLTWNRNAREWQFIGCSGTLISNRHVLTVAHCVYDRQNSMDAVYVNAYRPFAGNAGYPFHFSMVESYTTHEDFNNALNTNDVAIITLQTPVNLQNFPPLRIADTTVNIPDGEMMQVMGMGKLAERNELWPDTLQVAEIPFVSRTVCQSFHRAGRIRPDMICGGYVEGGPDACKGDSGGPLIALRNDEYGNEMQVQVGIVSWGVGCGRPNKPGVYTSIRFHYNWIRSAVCPQDPSSVEVVSEICGGPLAYNQPVSFPTLQPSQAPDLRARSESSTTSKSSSKQKKRSQNAAAP